MPAPAKPQTDLELVNMALACLGHTIRIGDLTNDTTLEAKIAQQWLETVRETAFSSFAWRWCETRALLVEATGTGAWWNAIADLWDHVYTAPTGMIAPNRIFNGARNEAPEEAIPFDWQLNAAGTGTVILTDEPPATDAPVLIYRRDPGVALYPQAFVWYLAWAIASAFAIPLGKNPQIQQNAEKARIFYLSQAAAIDQAGKRADQPPPTPSLSARGQRVRLGQAR